MHSLLDLLRGSFCYMSTGEKENKVQLAFTVMLAREGSGVEYVDSSANKSSYVSIYCKNRKAMLLQFTLS